MYARTAHGGGEDSATWEQAWGAHDHAGWFRDAARICHNDPISRWVEPAVARGGLFLEGGCGLAHWVKWLHHRGQRAIGLDFAPKLMSSARALDPELRLLVGDVLKLPLADGMVGVYLSNGVVEHWEDGPAAALAEARRVLAPDGVFLCTVPDASWLRRWLFRRDMTERGTLTARTVDETRVEPAPSGFAFYQYAFETEEFVARLRAAGFAVEEAVGESLMHGLFEVPGLKRAYQAAYNVARRLRPRRRAAGRSATATAAASAFDVEPRSSLLERALIREEPELPLVGPLVARAAEYCSTMRMYVARPC
jgi:SAM-dependent methyltransferase